MTKDETEGRIRAIEAVLLHRPGINWIRDPKRQLDSKAAEGKLAISGHLDEQQKSHWIN